MPRMGAARLQNVDPQAVQLQPPSGEVEGAIGGEGGDVPVEVPRQLSEGRVARRQVVQRGV